MLHRPSIVAGIIATLLAYHPHPAHATLLSAPGAPQAQAAPISPAQGKIDEGLKGLRAGDLKAAEAAFAEAARSDPKLPSAYIGLAEVAGRQNNVAQVESWLQKALDAEPNSAATQLVWGHYQFQRGRFVKAETAFKRAIELDARSAQARIYLADNYLRGLQKPKAAEEAYRAAIALAADSVPAQLGLASALAVQGRFDPAVAAFEQAAKLAPADPKPPHALARFYASQGKSDLALAALQRSSAIAPDFLPAHIDRGDLHLARNEVEQAANAYRAGAQATKKPALALFKLGTVRQGQQRWPEAEQAYLDAVKDDPMMFAAYNNLAFMAATRKEHLDEALVWVRKAMTLAPGVTTILDTLGWVHRARGELGPAVKALEQAVADNPKQASFRYHLGVTYSEQGRHPQARAALEKALELDKNFYMAADVKKRLQQIASK